MTVGQRRGGAGTLMTRRLVPKKVRKILCPDTKLGSRDALRVVLGVIEDVEHPVGEVLCDGTGHADETLHEEGDRLLT